MARALSKRRLDAMLVVVALVILLPTFWYRYGIDQAVYDYVGSGWLRGRLPYRDAFDVKPPGIYAVYAVAIALLGHHQASIHILEAAAVIVVAFLIADSREGQTHDGVFGICAVLLASWHAILFGFWDTAQAELWQSAFVVGSYSFMTRHADRRLMLFAAGVAASCAVLMKLTALPAVLVLLALLLFRSESSSRLPRVTAFGMGVAAPAVATLVYFVAAGGGPALLEWLEYVEHYGRAPLDPQWVSWTGPELLLTRCVYWLAILGACAILEPQLAPLGLLLATLVGIALQRRWLSYHGGALGPILVLSASGAIHRAVTYRRRHAALGACAVAAGSFVAAPGWTGNPALTYRLYTLRFWLPYVRKAVPTSEFDEAFGGAFDYRYAEHVAVSKLIESRHPAKSDGLHIRRFDPTLYALTDLYSPSRFMSEAPLQDAHLSQFRPEWQIEHRNALFGAKSPRFFVTRVGDKADLRLLGQQGYALLGSRGRYAVLEKGLAQRVVSEDEFRRTLDGADIQGTVARSLAFTASVQKNSLDLVSGGKHHIGTYHFDGDSTCVQAEGTATCFTLFGREEEYLAADGDGREVALFRRVR